MDEQPRLESITAARARSPARSRSNSRPRSLSSRLSRSNSLRHVHSAQYFDDHAVYSPQPSSTDESPAIADDAKSVSTELSSDRDLNRSRKELDKLESHELDAPELEVRNGIMDEKDIEAGPEPPKEPPGDVPKDPNLVTWDGPDDPANPKNWTMKRKWAATFIVSSFTFISPVSSSMVAPALSTMDRDLGVHTPFESDMILSIFVLAYAIGPLFLGPLSEVYGRVIVLQLSNLWFLFWNLACGFSRNGTQMLLFRFFSGLGGSAPLALGGGVLSDCWTADQRGKAISIYTLAPLLGPAVGPIAGGFIAERTTWRWVFWAVTLLDAAIQVSGFFFLQGTIQKVSLDFKPVG
jgi:multidrug resistance protein